MHCLLEIHSERKIFQYLMNSTLFLMRIMSVIKGYQQIRCQLYHNFKLPTIQNIFLNRDQSMHRICTKKFGNRFNNLRLRYFQKGNFSISCTSELVMSLMMQLSNRFINSIQELYLFSLFCLTLLYLNLFIHLFTYSFVYYYFITR